MRKILLIITCSFCGYLQAQKLTVESMALAGNDISASKFERKDLNGQACALLKVSLPSPGVKFEGNVIEPVEYKTGEYWVYMSPGSQELRIKHPQTHPLHVTFGEYGIKRMESKATYYLTVLLPSITAQQPQAQDQTAPVQQPKPVRKTIPPTIATSDALSKAVRPVIETITVKGVSFNMIRVEGGTFMMGATSEQQNPESDEDPVHKVTLSTYYIGETEVTQELWEAVMGKKPSTLKGKKLPIGMVFWKDCQKFISKLNKLTGKQFRLPTEAEWEYAARGGNMSRGYQYSGSDSVNDISWNLDNSEGKAHEVKLKQPNELGIYDMSGNVWEWCQDWYSNYTSDAQINPTGGVSSRHVVRGGCWGSSANSSRVTKRSHLDLNNAWAVLGLRLVY